MFINQTSLANPTWQAFERMIFRLLLQEGYDGVRLVGRSNDGGADIIARIAGKRWLFQAKNWRRPVGHDVLKETMLALKAYEAQVPVVVALNGFERGVKETRQVYLSESIPLQLWDRAKLIERASRLQDISLSRAPESRRDPRDYQEDAIRTIVQSCQQGHTRRALVVMATGLGKTFVAAEALQRIAALGRVKTLVLAHTNELVYQLERAFWPFLRPSQETIVWNGVERPDASALAASEFTFACVDSVAAAVERPTTLPDYDVIVVDECHHATASMYASVLDSTRAGEAGGPFLLGLTATPWRGDGAALEPRFGPPLVSIDLVTGMRKGFLANVDYRVYTSNIDWQKLSALRGRHFSPKAVNRIFFISEWDDSVAYALKETWEKQYRPRAIVFCGTIDHAQEMRDRINALGFCQAAAIFSGGAKGESLKPWERNRILADFDEGKIGVVCAVDIFNEGIDVPDVNILVFQRVTHSRRIFVQQLGRGLRIAPGKERVVVLDFVSDVRRFAADLDLKDQLGADGGPGGAVRVRLNNQVRFVRVGGDDPEAESFLRQWLQDVASIEDAEEDATVLKYPPAVPLALQQRGHLPD
jgi:superfamily II DNA or RNA helicase